MRARPPILPPGSKVHPQPLEAPRSVPHRCLRKRAGPTRPFSLGELLLPCPPRPCGFEILCHGLSEEKVRVEARFSSSILVHPPYHEPRHATGRRGCAEIPVEHGGSWPPREVPHSARGSRTWRRSHRHSFDDRHGHRPCRRPAGSDGVLL